MASTLEILARQRCSAILRTQDPDAVLPAMQAAVDGGFRVVEFTLNTPGALEQIAAFGRRAELVVGAGTVLTVEDAEAAAKAGARFLVSPVVDEEVIHYAVTNDLVVIPGAATPTEMLRAHRAGAQVVKVFPAPADGPGFIRACLGPLPFLRLFPTAGVTLDNVQAHLRAGAFGVGFVASLFKPADLAERRFDMIRDRAHRMTTAVRTLA